MAAPRNRSSLFVISIKKRAKMHINANYRLQICGFLVFVCFLLISFTARILLGIWCFYTSSVILKQVFVCHLTQGEGLRTSAASLLAAARPRSGSDSPPDCHSIPSRRFATTDCYATPLGGRLFMQFALYIELYRGRRA